ncbi:MAG: hypothetical protein HY072_00355 [Deltaproteobacteria bacterium]|nr:hypothetical protein [Deltaproteobacteria bacterium]
MNPADNNISLWHEKPDLGETENLIATTLPQAVEYAGGICETHGQTFELALPENIFQSKLGLGHSTEKLDRVTPFAEHASNDLPHIGLAHPLILNFANHVLDHISIDIIELRPRKEAQPQRVTEKLYSVFTLRPSKIELTKQEQFSRVWIHSVYLFGFEAANLGNKLKHFLQDQQGRFLNQPESYLKRLHSRLGEFEVLRHFSMPEKLVFNFKEKKHDGVSEKAFQEEFKIEITRVQNEEMNKAIIYYDRLEEDLQKRVVHEKERQGKPVSLDLLETKLERVRAERNIRLGNIQERFRAQFRIAPVGGRILILPTYRCRLQPNALSEAFINVDYCPVLREFLLPTCTACQQPSRDWILKSNLYLCTRCA